MDFKSLEPSLSCLTFPGRYFLPAKTGSKTARGFGLLLFFFFFFSPAFPLGSWSFVRFSLLGAQRNTRKKKTRNPPAAESLSKFGFPVGGERCPVPRSSSGCGGHAAGPAGLLFGWWASCWEGESSGLRPELLAGFQETRCTVTSAPGRRVCF